MPSSKANSVNKVTLTMTRSLHLKILYLKWAIYIYTYMPGCIQILLLGRDPFSMMEDNDKKYRQTFHISCTKSQNLDISRLVFQLSLPNPYNRRLSQQWRRSWSSAGRRVINNVIAYMSATYFRGFTVTQIHLMIITNNVTQLPAYKIFYISAFIW